MLDFLKGIAEYHFVPSQGTQRPALKEMYVNWEAVI